LTGRLCDRDRDGPQVAVRVVNLDEIVARRCAYDLPWSTPPSMVEHIGGCLRTA